LIGLRPEVKPGVIAFNDSTFIFVCGNNIVIQNIDLKTQRYIPGIEGASGITFFCLSPCKRYIAVCEKAS
jgi:hypothetical protein